MVTRMREPKIRDLGGSVPVKLYWRSPEESCRCGKAMLSFERSPPRNHSLTVALRLSAVGGVRVELIQSESVTWPEIVNSDSIGMVRNSMWAFVKLVSAGLPAKGVMGLRTLGVER